MAYDFHARLRHAGDRFKEMAELVTITRGASTTSQVRAFAILQRATELIPGVSMTRLEYQDFVFDSADYQVGGSAVLPQLGDTLTRADGHAFRVVSLGDNEPPFRYVTADRDRFRIHYERVAA